MSFSISKFIKENRVYFIWLAFGLLLYLFRNLFGLVFLTFIMCFIASGIMHTARRKFKINRRLTVISLYLIFSVAVILFLAVIPSRILSEAIVFTEKLPQSIATISLWLHHKLEEYQVTNTLLAQIENVIFPQTSVTDLWNLLRGLLNNTIHYFGWFFIAMLFSFLIMLDLPTLARGIRRLRNSRLSEAYHETADSIIAFAQVVGENFRAQLFISMINTILTAIGLYLLNVQAISLLCTIVFICGLIPVLGMIISSVPIILMAINDGGIELGLWVAIMIIAIHMIETYILNPNIVSSFMHINPVMTLIILYIAHSIAGIWGMLLGIPTAVYFYRKISINSKH